MLAIVIVGMGSVGAAGFANAAGYSNIQQVTPPGYSIASQCWTDSLRTQINIQANTNETASNTSSVQASLKIIGKPVDVNGIQIGPNEILLDTTRKYGESTAIVGPISFTINDSTKPRYDYVITGGHFYQGANASTPWLAIGTGSTSVTCKYLSYKK